MSKVLRGASVALIAGTMAALSVTPAAPAPGPQTERVTVSASGEQLSEGGGGPDLSADGRYAVFGSSDSRLVPGDTNGIEDYFVRDLRSGTVERVNVASDGTQADGGSYGTPDISDDGRYVTFLSSAKNLVDWPDGPPQYASDVYLHDRRTGRTERISVGADGGSGGAFDDPVVSRGGRYVAFVAQESWMEADNTNGQLAAYVADRRTGEIKRVSNRAQPSWSVQEVVLTPDGRHLAYSYRHPRGGRGEVRVVDLRTGTEELANAMADGSPSAGAPGGLTISADGRYVSFISYDDSLVPEAPAYTNQGYVRDLRDDTTYWLDHDGEGELASRPVLSPDGRYLAYAWETLRPDDDRVENIYVRDLRTGHTGLATETTAGGPLTEGYSAPVSFAGKSGLLGFYSTSSDLVPGDTNGQADGFVRHLR